MKNKTKKGITKRKYRKSITKRKYRNNLTKGGMNQEEIGKIYINIKTGNDTESKEINITSPLLSQLKTMYDCQYIRALFGGIDITDEQTAIGLGIEEDSTISLIMEPREPKVFNVLSTTNEYNIPNKYIDLFNNRKIGIYGSEPPHIKKEMIEMGYYQEIETFIKKNKAQIGDILFVGGNSSTRPIECFAIVVENDKYIIGEEPNNGMHTVFSKDVLPILKKYGIKYKKCLQEFSTSKNMINLWIDFIDGVEWDEEQIGYYQDEDIWE